MPYEYTFESVNEVLIETCPSLSERDRTYIANLICKNVPVNIKNEQKPKFEFYEFVASMAYLYSKCPANADKPISYRKLRETLRNNFCLKLSRGILDVNSAGFMKQYCHVTASNLLKATFENLHDDVIIRISDKYSSYAQTVTYSKQHIFNILNGAIQLSEHDDVYPIIRGKSPYVSASACMFLSSIMYGMQLSYAECGSYWNVSGGATSKSTKNILKGLGLTWSVGRTRRYDSDFVVIRTIVTGLSERTGITYPPLEDNSIE